MTDGYYDDPKNVAQYIDMADGYDGQLLIDVLHQYLPDRTDVLELGMGPGKDLRLLSKHYTETGSDSSQVFLDRYKIANPGADLLLLDAAIMDTDRKFDGIYSNKVLYHLEREALNVSFQRQAEVLRAGGIALHSFWYGDSVETMHGLIFTYYNEETLRQAVGESLKIVEIARYTEMEQDDSLYIVLQRK